MEDRHLKHKEKDMRAEFVGILDSLDTDKKNKIIAEMEKTIGLAKGMKVRYIGLNKRNSACINYPQYCGSPADPRGLLNTETTYEIDCIRIARSWSQVKLVGFKEKFSPQIFAEIKN